MVTSVEEGDEYFIAIFVLLMKIENLCVEIIQTFYKRDKSI